MLPMKINIAVLVSGRGSNFEALAQAALKDDYPARIALLVSDNPGAGALRTAERMKIESKIVDCGGSRGGMTAESSREIMDFCVERQVKLVCLAGFMRIVKGPLMDEYSGRMMNIHPALLPSFKGLDAQKQALDYGVRLSGCTVHFVDGGIDTGPIIIQRAVPVLRSDTQETLSSRILAEEHSAYPEAVRLFAEGRLSVDGRKVIIDERQGDR